jgi:predicted membrane protein
MKIFYKIIASIAFLVIWPFFCVWTLPKGLISIWKAKKPEVKKPPEPTPKKEPYSVTEDWSKIPTGRMDKAGTA